MQLRTFLAESMSRALAAVRDEMGPDAVILSSEATADGGVMVRAALDPADAFDDIAFSDSAELPNAIEPEVDIAGIIAQARQSQDAGRIALSGGSAPPRVPSRAAPPRAFRPAVSRPAGATRPASSAPAPAAAEVRRMREAPLGMREPGGRRFDRGELLTLFAHHRLPDALAHALAEASAGTGLKDMTLALAAAIDARMQSAPLDFARCRGVLLAGLGGAGKTATAAKLAAHAQLAGREVLLIAADAEGAGAVARLSAFAEHLEAKLVVAGSPALLARAVREALGRGMLPIVDTAGFDPRQPGPPAAAGAADIETIGVVSALTDSEEMGEIASALSAHGACRLIVTQTDLARRLGALATAAMAGSLGFAYITRSPFVAGGLDGLTPLSLARLLVENEEESVQ